MLQLLLVGLWVKSFYLTQAMSVGSTLMRMNVLFRQHFLMLLDHPSHTIHASCALFAGHNKWSKVKHVKGPKDMARSHLFQKLTMMIRLAVKEGGPNPDLNTNLANIIEQCRSKSMPKSSIEAAITRGVCLQPYTQSHNIKHAAVGYYQTLAVTDWLIYHPQIYVGGIHKPIVQDKIKSSYLIYEARGPGGVSLLIEILTDNAKRSFQEIRHLLNQHGGISSDGARHSFEKKGIIAVSGKDQSGSPVSLDQALELAIEAGAEDVQEEEDEDEKAMFRFICARPTLSQVREKLDSMGLCSISASLEFIPTITIQLSDEEMEQASQLLEALGNCLDVVRVYDNIA